ncbi:aromatic acid exporter family protein [Halalkalibacterium halodurans]|jgi:uncharacterized membrane protein YgaE (UPF0421/DUF939 family)|uniref:BH0942 protein n=2 Tax=Halalkalibacterium halodurans TaxID=86665 RepID=Q9KEB1_HALH5|nr:aromatic acid exporter family protein [Halalkalibacterium halodurans]MDY7221440.1 aromatic acid exporter family protein [Halalkalibacterium halodurans]MDY7240679.1 aromatic acid exporter family protein [Halalkalibacterium halodurans]MED3648379.1 aromatic acid exporter family protein [Halalkalibacterium halodurans]MED4082967.1 aromatic acid exporter family protein [Halalkalibacterium halodurans]MED4086798.1 aromatic acid exporter family protein [Halalkalibacterium halodurans]
MKLGARIFKTGLAVMLSLYLAIWLQFDSPVFAALTAAFAVQPSIYRTFQTILDQVQANVIGAIIAVIFAVTFGHEPFVIAVVIVITIALILKLKLDTSTISIALVTIIVIMESPVENFVDFATDRFLLIMLGVVSAFLVNLVFIPPRYETKLYHKIVKNTEDIIQWLMLFIRRDANPQSLKKDLSRLNENLIKIDQLYLFYKEERNYFIRTRYAKARKIVLFRQMVATTKKAFTVLKNLERRSDYLHYLPDETQALIENQLHLLTTYHDRILLRYIGKVSPQCDHQINDELNEGKSALTDAFMAHYQDDNVDADAWSHLLPAISQLIEYQEQLEHLDHLVDSFFNYHQKANKVQINEMDE